MKECVFPGPTRQKIIAKTGSLSMNDAALDLRHELNHLFYRYGTWLSGFFNFAGGARERLSVDIVMNRPIIGVAGGIMHRASLLPCGATGEITDWCLSRQ